MKSPSDETKFLEGTFLYLLKVPSYTKYPHSKIGISINPDRRCISLRSRYGTGISVFKRWYIEDKKEAFSIENDIKTSNAIFMDKECLHDTPEKILEYIERKHPNLKECLA